MIVIDGVRPSSCALSQCLDAFIATGPLTPMCVQSSAPVSRVPTAPSIQIVSSTSCETPASPRMKTCLPRTSGTSAGVGGTMV